MRVLNTEIVEERRKVVHSMVQNERARYMLLEMSNYEKVITRYIGIPSLQALKKSCNITFQLLQMSNKRLVCVSRLGAQQLRPVIEGHAICEPAYYIASGIGRSTYFEYKRKMFLGQLYPSGTRTSDARLRTQAAKTILQVRGGKDKNNTSNQRSCFNWYLNKLIAWL